MKQTENGSSTESESSTTSPNSNNVADNAQTIHTIIVLLIIRLGAGILSLLPIFFSLWIAGSRIADNRHHPSDVLVGYFIGTVSGLTSLVVLTVERRVRVGKDNDHHA